MANRKILIEFTANPTVGNAFSYDITIDETAFLYPNGLTTLNLDYVSGSDVAFTSIGIKPTLSETIDNTLNFLVQYYYSSFITYTRVDNSIEVILNFDNGVVTYPEDANENILISDDAYAPNVSFKLKYLIDWADMEQVPYSVRIYQKGYTGTSTNVSGYAVLKYGSVKDNLDSIRGNGLELNLNASTDLTLEDLYTEEENSFAVKMYRRNKLLFDGYLKPDGVYQSFVQDQWMLSLSCVDGLGLLKDLAFVQPNGLHWTGKQKAIDVIYNCLNRTGLQMNINTSVNIYYEGLEPTDNLDPLNETYVSVDRFVKDDNDTIMDCNEVLTSILNLFNAVICQIEGQWYIFRPNEIYNNPIVKFRQYSETDNSYIKLNTKNLEFSLGSQINNFYPHHSGGNQQIEIKGSVSATRINYKYGFEKSILLNKFLIRDNSNVFENWTVISPNLIIYDPLDLQGLKSNIIFDNPGVNPIALIVSDNIFLELGTTVNFKLKSFFNSQFFNPSFLSESIFHFVKIELVGIYQTAWIDVSTYLNPQDFEWKTTSPSVASRIEANNDFSYNVPMPALPFDGDLRIIIYQSKGAAKAGKPIEITEIDIINTSNANAKTGAVGEFHTAQRQNRPSSISTETFKIFNGDSPTVIYEGAVLKENQISPTSFWFRNGKNESKPILQIAVEDILRLQQKPQKLFTGDIYGYMSYLSVISIDNLEGKFLPIEWSFDALRNTTTVKLLQFFGDELNDIDYKFTLDYGNTVKPTITS